jgi:hypothetical protein
VGGHGPDGTEHLLVPTSQKRLDGGAGQEEFELVVRGTGEESEQFGGAMGVVFRRERDAQCREGERQRLPAHGPPVRE